MKKETYVLCKMINCGFRHKKMWKSIDFGKF